MNETPNKGQHISSGMSQMSPNGFNRNSVMNGYMSQGGASDA